THTYSFSHTHSPPNTHTFYRQTDTHRFTHMHSHVQKHTHKHTPPHTHTQTHTPLTHRQTHTDTHTCTHMYKHTHTHTHTHTRTHSPLPLTNNEGRFPPRKRWRSLCVCNTIPWVRPATAAVSSSCSFSVCEMRMLSEHTHN